MQTVKTNVVTTNRGGETDSRGIKKILTAGIVLTLEQSYKTDIDVIQKNAIKK